jgi:predicted peptidase
MSFMRANEMSAAEPVPQKTCNLERTIKITMTYLLYLPKDYEQKPSWPLMLYLHGGGERGKGPDAVKRTGPPQMIEAGHPFPFIVVSPLCPKERWWEPLELTALLDDIVRQYKVDQDRIYVMGHSMGGFGTWLLAAYTPNRFAAVVPICGFGSDPLLVRLFPNTPVWVFHGAKDQLVPLERSKQMVEALKKCGGSVKFTVYPEAGHDAWTQTYANPEVYEWLLQQKRTPKKPRRIDKVNDSSVQDN